MTNRRTDKTEIATHLAPESKTFFGFTALQDYLVGLNSETKTSVVTDTATKNLAAE